MKYQRLQLSDEFELATNQIKINVESAYLFTSVHISENRKNILSLDDVNTN